RKAVPGRVGAHNPQGAVCCPGQGDHRHVQHRREPGAGAVPLPQLSKIGEGCAILVREEFSCLEFIMNRDTINWILKKLNTGGRTWSIYQRKSITTGSAIRWWETTTSPI